MNVTPQTKPRQNRDRPVQVRRAGRHLIVRPPVPALSQVLRVPRLSVEAVDTGAEVRREWSPLLCHDSVSGINRQVGPAAVEPLVLEALDVLGVSYDLTGKRPGVLAVDAVDGLVDRPLVERVTREERLVVRYGPGVNRVRLGVDVCRAFPHLRVGVLAKRRDDVRRVAHLLMKAGESVAEFREGTPLDHGGCRVSVATFQAAGHGGAGLWAVDLLVVLDLEDALGEQGRAAVELAHRDHPDAPRLVAFTPEDFAPSVSQKAEILTTYGPYMADVPMHGLIGRPVEYDSFTVYSLIPGNTYDTISNDMINGVNTNKIGKNNTDNLSKSLATLRHKTPIATAIDAFANDPVVLRRGADLASALVAGDAAGVARICPRLAGHPRLGRPASVLVVAGSPSQARRLLRKLPGWSPLDADLRSLPADRPRWGWPAGKPVPALCTACWLQFAGVGRYDVVVRLDGSGVVPSLVANDGNDLEPLLVIDVAVPGRPEIERLLSARRATYEERGWLPAGSRHGPELLKFIRSQHSSPRARCPVERLLRPKNVSRSARRG